MLSRCALRLILLSLHPLRLPPSLERANHWVLLLRLQVHVFCLWCLWGMFVLSRRVPTSGPKKSIILSLLISVKSFPWCDLSTLPLLSVMYNRWVGHRGGFMRIFSNSMFKPFSGILVPWLLRFDWIMIIKLSPIMQLSQDGAAAPLRYARILPTPSVRSFWTSDEV